MKQTYCDLCGKDRLELKNGCIYDVYKYKGTQYTRIKYGYSNRDVHMGDTCPDCGVPIGKYHCIGCDWEECPVCHTLKNPNGHAMQFISCDHCYDNDEADIDRYMTRAIVFTFGNN